MTIAVIIVNWNTGPLLAECVRSVLDADRTTSLVDRIVVVDNASSDDSPAMLAAYVDAHPRIRLFRSTTNRGYAGAVRRAAELREPFEVAHYLYELASVFNAFYNKHVVLDVAEPVRSRARLALVKATQVVLRSGLQLLGIRAMDQM